jgi:hypothetical protein
MVPEVLIYIRTVKTYIQSNEEAKEYFIADSNPEDFYQQIQEISEKNFEKHGDPMLTKEQFESVRESLKTKSKPKEEKLFFELKGFGKICLN